MEQKVVGLSFSGRGLKNFAADCPPRALLGRCAICGSTRHYSDYTSQCTRPVKLKAKNAEWDDSTWHYEDDERHDTQWEFEEYEASKGKKGKGKGSKPKGSPKVRMRRDLSLQGRQSPHPRKVTDPNPKPNPKHVHAWQMTSSSPWCLQSLSQHGDTRHVMEMSTWCVLSSSNRKRSCQCSKLVSGHWSQTAESPSMDMMLRAWSTSHCISTWPSSVIV